MTMHFLNETSSMILDRFDKSIITSCKLINRKPGPRLLISSLPGSALRMHVESLGKPHNVNNHSQSLAW